MKHIEANEWIGRMYYYGNKFPFINTLPTYRRREIMLLAALGTSKQEEKSFNYIIELQDLVLEKCSEKYKVEYYK